MHVFLIPSDEHDSEEIQEEEKPSDNPLDSLLKLNGRTSLYWTAKALAECNAVRSVSVVCDGEYQASLRPELPDDPRFKFEEFSSLDSKKTSSLSQSIEEIGSTVRSHIKAPTLIVSCTYPHWTAKVYGDIISRFRDSDIDTALFYVLTSEIENKTAIFRDAVYVLYCAVVGPGAVEGGLKQVEKFSPQIAKLDARSAAARQTNPDAPPPKTPTGLLISIGWKVISIIGAKFIFDLLRKKMTPSMVEKKLGKVLNTSFKMIELSDDTLHLRLSEGTHRPQIEKLLARRN